MRRLLMPAVLFGLIFVSNLHSEDKKAEVPTGFTPLFNGKDLTGWKVLNGKMELWGADKGILFVDGKGGGWLMTEKEYDNFELRLEFKVPKMGNSGVALRLAAPWAIRLTWAWRSRFWMTRITRGKGLRPAQHTGSIYDVLPPTEEGLKANKPFGEWNTYKITAQGRKVTIELNGVKAVDANLDDYVKEHGKKHPGLSREKGHLGLQSHDGRVEFRNIYVKAL